MGFGIGGAGSEGYFVSRRETRGIETEGEDCPFVRPDLVCKSACTTSRFDTSLKREAEAVEKGEPLRSEETERMHSYLLTEFLHGRDPSDWKEESRDVARDFHLGICGKFAQF